MADSKTPHVLNLTEQQKKNFTVRLALTDEQRKEIHAQTGLDAEAIEVPVTVDKGSVHLIIKRDMVCW